MTRLHLCMYLILSMTVQQLMAQDHSFQQVYAVKYYATNGLSKAGALATDRNARTQVLFGNSLYRPVAGLLQYPGKLAVDRTYRYDSEEHIVHLLTYQSELVYLTDKAIYSNAWAGSLYLPHAIDGAYIMAADSAFHFLVAGNDKLSYVSKKGGAQVIPWDVKDRILGLTYDRQRNLYWLLTEKAVHIWDPSLQKPKRLLSGADHTCLALTHQGRQLLIGTKEGYLKIDLAHGPLPKSLSVSSVHRQLPCNALTSIRQIDGNIWFGSLKGAFCLNADGQIDYYQGEMWLPSDTVVAISPGPASSIWIATNNGLSQLHLQAMTLAEKADFYLQQVRNRHIRSGLNATLKGLQHGDLSTGFMSDSDNDGLWTSMYLAAEALRYAVDRDTGALYNCRESLLAMEKLFSVNPLQGFPSRSFERIGHKEDLSDKQVWLDAPDGLWSWKSTTSSDEAIGHMFAYSVIAELVDDPSVKQLAIALMDSLMGHIVEHDLYLVDHDGKPTLWGKWNPGYVNQFPTNIGDRKLNSSNIISMLQSAYHFTRKAKYKEKALELMQKHGYYENLMRPMASIGRADEQADDRSKLLSDRWNHSDDEMYFLGYWGLYRYALDERLKNDFRQAILDHWQYEEPEKDALWNFLAAMVGATDYDLTGARWFLQEFPLDLINWPVQNSHRKDLHFLDDNFMSQSTDKVLSPRERPVHRHNRTTFVLDEVRGSGNEEFSAGDIWLLPYWLGRYLNLL